MSTFATAAADLGVGTRDGGGERFALACARWRAQGVAAAPADVYWAVASSARAQLLDLVPRRTWEGCSSMQGIFESI